MAIVIVDGSFWCLHDPDKSTSMSSLGPSTPAASYLAFVQIAASRLWLKFVHTT